MVSNKNLHKVAKFLEWMILLGLLAGAIVFQVEAWDMYLSGDSSFKIKEENIQEGPTLTFCPREGVEIEDVIIAIFFSVELLEAKIALKSFFPRVSSDMSITSMFPLKFFGT